MGRSPAVDRPTAARFHGQGNAARWGVSIAAFQDVLEASVAHAFTTGTPGARDLESYLASLHHDDLALATACAAGLDAAWDHFVREFRPGLYRAADAIDPSGGARELADSLYADLFGMTERQGVRQSLFRYFHGRSRLTTWLRAVLAQRHVDRLRRARATDPLPEEEFVPDERTRSGPGDPEQPRLLAAVHDALASAVVLLPPRDRLRLRCYYVQAMTLAAIGRTLGEHEATVSRHLTKTRATLRETVARVLREQHGLGEAAVTEALRAASDDPGALDLATLMGPDPERGSGRKNDGLDRSR